MHETFWTLLRDQAHWEFEIFLQIVLDGVLLGLCWPFIKKHWAHHVHRDNVDAGKVQLIEKNLDTKISSFATSIQAETISYRMDSDSLGKTVTITLRLEKDKI